MARVGYHLQNVITFCSGILSEASHLLPETVAALGLLFGRHPGIEDSPLRGMAVGGKHS
jgi:hypothetical protein